MTKTSKSERKWGKKEPTEETKKPKGKKQEDKQEDMYKILVDNSGFTKAMNYEDCQKLIRKYQSNAKRLNRKNPSLVLVKQ
jgi:uncharacterized protein with gpF-like domain